MDHRSYCGFHLGDNLVHLHFLRKLALANPDQFFSHAVHECHISQLREAVEDVANINLVDLEFTKVTGWRDVWKNAGGFWEHHRLRHDFAGFYLDWFSHLAAEMGLASPFSQPSDLFFDYPAILGGQVRRFCAIDPSAILLINSAPCSGQFTPYNGPDYFAPLVVELHKAGKLVITTELIPSVRTPCTRHWNASITNIGEISLRCQAVVAVATGPLWPCLNVWNKDKPFVVMLNHVLGEESLESLKPNLTQVKSAELAMSALKEKGLL